ncbi:MAG: ATP-binding domain-containing protein, partial [Actinomycetes bacterium]
DLFEELGQWSGTKTLSLETNFRFSRQASANLSGLRQELIAASNSGSSPPDSTRILEDSLDGGDFEDLNRNIELISPDYSVAVLTRDNATALRASAILWDSGIPHQLRQPQRDRPVAGWIAGVFDSSNSLTSEKMAERISELSATSPVSPSNTERAWRILSQLDRGGAQTGSIRGNEVAASIRMGRAPAELTERNHQRITVSTIHRAKGLEFDVCLIVEPYANRNGVNALEIRILFVALTRARHDVMHVATPGIAGNAWWTKDQRSGGRFVKRTMRHRSTLGIEVRVDDSDPSVPPGFHSPNYDSQAIQQKLRTQVFAGDKVTLARRETGALGLDGFNIIHETEGLIGITQIGFDECAQQNSPGRLPAGVSGLYVQDIETVAGDNQTASAAGLGNSGLWLRPRIAGLGDFS